MAKKVTSLTDIMFVLLSWCTWAAGGLVLLMLVVDSDGKSIGELLAWACGILVVTWGIAKLFRACALGDE